MATITPFTTASTASAVLSLSKRAWKLGIVLSKLDQDADFADTMTKALTEDVKLLGIECDLVYTELEMDERRGETGLSLLCDVDNRVWGCLEVQIKEISQTMQEVEILIERVKAQQTGFFGQAQRQWKLDESRQQVASFGIVVCRHIDSLHTIALLIDVIVTHIVPCRVDQRFSEKLYNLKDVIEKLHRSSRADPQSHLSHTEATLMQCTREVIATGSTLHDASLSSKSFAGGQKTASGGIRVVEWVETLESIRRDQRCLETSDKIPSLHAHRADDVVANDSDDDLETDLAKAALDTGTKAFERQGWAEADSLLQEALRVLQQLPSQQRAFCDIFSLHYKLAVCAYHTQGPADAEMALMSLVQQTVSSDAKRVCSYNAAHLLAQLYIRIGQVDRARSECEKALQARRRLLGKQSDASLESMALMAHIYVLLNNRARAKSCLAMIPEARRDAVIQHVEGSLGAEVEHLDFSSLLTQSASEDPDLITQHIQSRLSGSTVGLAMEYRPYHPSSIVTSPAPSIRQPCQPSQLRQDNLRSISLTSSPPQAASVRSKAVEESRFKQEYSTDAVALDNASLCVSEPPEVNESTKGRHLSRKAVLDNIGCQPRDRIEEAVCDGDHSALTSLLDKKTDFWRSKLRKRVRPERLTALHFAALFGEIDMARRLLNASFNINDVPYGYTTSLSPLKIAIGARQTNMVEFLIANGAKPCEPDSWSTLAAQLMSRSWLMKTLSEAEREFVPNRIVAILNVLLRHGWDVNAPFESSGATILHQAVTFWSGEYLWDLDLRAAVTSFLCARGANPHRTNREGKTPYDLALASRHQDLLVILDKDSKRKDLHNMSEDLIELSG